MTPCALKGMCVQYTLIRLACFMAKGNIYKKQYVKCIFGRHNHYPTILNMKTFNMRSKPLVSKL